MIKHETIKELKECHTLQEFIHLFYRVFTEKLKANLAVLEATMLNDLLIEGKYNQIRLQLEEMVTKAQKKVLECVQEGVVDTVYNSRYTKLVELSDLITYFIEEKEFKK